MIHDNLDFTVCSTDPEHYNRISTKLPAPITKYSKVIVSSLTANCDIMVLNSDDYIMIRGIQYSFKQDFTNINRETITSLLQKYFESLELDISISLDTAGRVCFKSYQKFYIDRMTYNFSILTGFYNTTFPIHADYKEDPTDASGGIYYIRANSTGFTLSTPILYLLSNVGFQSYRNINDDDIVGSRIVMRLNNAFSANMPIVVNNADFIFTVPSNDLSMLEFTLVDAYQHEVKLLSPMYITINVRSVPDEEITPAIFNEMQQQQQQK